MHAVDRFAGIHELVQGLQHQSIAAERDDHVGFGDRYCHSAFPIVVGFARLRRLAGDEGNMPKRLMLLALGGSDDGTRGARLYELASIVEAEQAGRTIVERRLAACVNILPGMISHYWWKGKIERAEEVVMIFKTRASMAEPMRGVVKELHTYTTPAFMVLPCRKR